MVAGSATVRGSFLAIFLYLGSLLFGLFSQHLWFRSAGKPEIVIRGSDERAAHRCRPCGAVSIYPLARRWD